MNLFNEHSLDFFFGSRIDHLKTQTLIYVAFGNIEDYELRIWSFLVVRLFSVTPQLKTFAFSKLMFNKCITQYSRRQILACFYPLIVLTYQNPPRHRYFTSKNSSIPNLAPSLPSPDSFHPPYVPEDKTIWNVLFRLLHDQRLILI